MKKALSLAAILEIVAGIVLFLYPSAFYYGGPENVNAIPILKLYGILASCFGVLLLLVSKEAEKSSNLFIKSYLIAMGLNMALGFYTYGMYQAGQIPFIGATITHLSLFLILIIAYFLFRFEKQ